MISSYLTEFVSHISSKFGLYLLMFGNRKFYILKM